MKYAEINKRYTEIVSEYISKGYILNTATMAGSQGEIASVDLTSVFRPLFCASSRGLGDLFCSMAFGAKPKCLAYPLIVGLLFANRLLNCRWPDSNRRRLALSCCALPLSYSGIFLELAAGIEPATIGLQD